MAASLPHILRLCRVSSWRRSVDFEFTPTGLNLVRELDTPFTPTVIGFSAPIEFLVFRFGLADTVHLSLGSTHLCEHETTQTIIWVRCRPTTHTEAALATKQLL